MNGDSVIFRGGARLLRVALVLAAVGALGLTIGAFVDRRQLFYAYLTAYAWAVSIAGGALIFLMIAQHATWASSPISLGVIVLVGWALVYHIYDRASKVQGF